MTVDAALVGTLDRNMDWLMMPESEKFTDLLCYLAPFIPWPLVHVTGKLLGFSTYYALVLYCDASRKNYCTLLYVFSMKLAVLNFLRLKRGINNCNNNIPHTNSLQNTSTSANVIHRVF